MADHEISALKAHFYAQTFLKHSQISLGDMPPGFFDLNKVTCAFVPITIKDINGGLLFYDFSLSIARKRVGTMRIAANDLLGYPLVSIHEKITTDNAVRRKQVSAKIKKQANNPQIVSMELVCFNYPRLGFLVTFNTSIGETKQVIVDPEFPESEMFEVPEGGAGDIEGEVAYSVLNSLPEGGAQSSRAFTGLDKIMDDLTGNAFVPLVPPASSGQQQAFSAHMANLLLPALQDMPEGIGAPSEKVIDIPFESQKTPDFCVLACMDMLAHKLGVVPPTDQDSIEALLTQAPALYNTGGIRPSDQLASFGRVFSPALFSVAIDSQPSWDKSIAVIDQGRAFKSGIIGHARVACGYSIVPITGPSSNSPIQTQRFLWLNDPANGHTLELQEVVTQNKQTGGIQVTTQNPIKSNMVTVTPKGL